MSVLADEVLAVSVCQCVYVGIPYLSVHAVLPFSGQLTCRLCVCVAMFGMTVYYCIFY